MSEADIYFMILIEMQFDAISARHFCAQRR